MRPRLAALAACAALIAAAPSLGNIIGPTDDRGTLGELGPGLGMSAADIERFRGATGFVVCSGSVHAWH